MANERTPKRLSIPKRSELIGRALDRIIVLRDSTTDAARLGRIERSINSLTLRKQQLDSVIPDLQAQEAAFSGIVNQLTNPVLYDIVRAEHERALAEIESRIPFSSTHRRPEDNPRVNQLLATIRRRPIDSVEQPSNVPQEPLQILRDRYFLAPDGSNVLQTIRLVETAIKTVVASQGEAPTYPITTGIPTISELVEHAEIPQHMSSDPENILRSLPALIQGVVKSGHPFMVKNIIPTASLPALAAYLAVSPYMANGVSGEDAAQMLLSEPATASAISKLAGIDSRESAGIFTFGGTGTNLYAMKIGLSKVLPEHSKTGIREDVVVIESAPSHYSHKTTADWLGVGQNNILRVSSHPDQTTKLDELEQTARQALDSGKKLACIIAVGGTTSNMGIDNIEQVVEIRDRLVEEYNLPYSPHVHVDSVLGWAFLNFGSYDFDKNPLGFRPKTIAQLKKVLNRVKTFKYADSFGVDFHKTGYVPYVSSMIVVKDKRDLQRLERDGKVMTPLFHDDEAYNPGKFTLETSRSAASMLATWAALQTFGQEGYQSLLGHAIEMGVIFREQVEQHINQGLYVANQEQFGPDVFVRCYPPNVKPEDVYAAEMVNDELLKQNNAYTTSFFKWLNKHLEGSEQAFAVSKSSAAIYTHTGHAMDALRIYPLNPYITEETARELVRRLVRAKTQFDREMGHNYD